MQQVYFIKFCYIFFWKTKVEKFFKEARFEKRIHSNNFTLGAGTSGPDDVSRGGLASTAIHLLTGLKTETLAKADIKEGTVEQLIKDNRYVCASMRGMYKDSGLNHGVVVVSYDDKYIYINDSTETTDKPKPIKKEDFYNMCIGLTLTDGKTKLGKNEQINFQKHWGI